MNSLRRKPLWLIWLVGLALVITSVGSPAQAFACVELPATASAVPAEGHWMACASVAQEADCCCEPPVRVTQSDEDSSVATAASGCDCSVDAPDVPPAPAVKVGSLVVPLDLAVIPVASLSVELPNFKIWQLAAPTTGPPLKSCNSSGPSRAPPAL